MTDGRESANDVVPLGTVSEIVMGQSPPGSSCNRSGIGTPLLNGPTEFGFRHPQPAQWTTEPARVAEAGDTLFCVRGSTTGRMNVADVGYAVGRGVAAIRGSDAADTVFIRAALHTGLPELLALATGTVFPNISGADLRQFDIPWPEQPERRRVASLLVAADRCVDLARSTRQLALETAQCLLETAEQNCEVGDIATSGRNAFVPSKHPGDFVDHFSLPAFDAGGTPDRVRAETIASSKLLLSGPCVLVSKLNPGTNRTWLAIPADDAAWSACSTEYAVLTPKDATLFALFAAVSGDDIGDSLAAGTTGTSASHQRVKASEILSVTIPDPRCLSDDAQQELATLGDLFVAKSRQVTSLLAYLRFALPRLLLGELTVAESAESQDAAS